jgi:hypothetical protein
MSTQENSNPTEGEKSGQSKPPITLTDLIVGAQRVHLQSLAGVSVGLQKRYDDANAVYARALQTVQSELGERYQAAYNIYAERVSGALTQTERYDRCIAAYRAYVEKLRQLLYGTNVASDIARAQAKLLASYAQLKDEPGPIQGAREALDAYASDVSRILGQQQLRSELETTHAAYVETLNHLNDDLQQIHEDATNRMIDAQKRAWEETGAAERGKNALHAYVATMTDTLAASHEAVETAAKAAANFVRKEVISM